MKDLWTDSTITLAWIRSRSRIWTTLVANRVSSIQTNTDSKDWRHVNGVENLADFITRGCAALELKNSQMWWHGPEWLKLDQSQLPVLNVRVDMKDVPERNRNTLVLVAERPHEEV
ncbi:hypothetical protein QE152_g23714 [Popillia japonica]|uniref:Uncharacterized protein n=1 Tax=Popillia japonica TaxID=7064 RepID=A0AAW1KG25_POPJA